MRVRAAALIVSALVWSATSGCGGVVDPSRNVIDNFSGTILEQGGAVVHDFDTRRGEFEVRITAVSPAVAFLGVTWGRLQNSNCAFEYTNNFAVPNNVALFGPVQANGRHCVAVYDSGGLVTEPTTYTVRVSHP